jgi:hypothetical protein
VPPGGTERALKEARVKHLEEKVDDKELVAFHWAVAELDGKRYRVNGQHSSTMLARRNGNFPEDAVVHLHTYSVADKDGLVNLFRQLDPRTSTRSAADIAGAYQGIEDDLDGVARPIGKQLIDGVVWWRKHVEKVPVPKGDLAFTIFAEDELHEFIRWGCDVITLKTPELARRLLSPPCLRRSRSTRRRLERSGRKGCSRVGRHPPGGRALCQTERGNCEGGPARDEAR